MIEIEGTASKKTIEKFKGTKKKKKSSSPDSVEVVHSEFLDVLEEIKVEDKYDLQLSDLIKEIDLQGKSFKKNPTLQELKKYKTLIKNFLDVIVEKSYKISEKSGIRRSLKQKLFKNIEIINLKLDDISKTVISDQIDSIELASKIDEIRGLLIDLWG